MNNIYDMLVNGEDDLIGLIAYSLYKGHKIEFIENIENEHKRCPTKEDFEAFNVSASTEGQLDKYRDAAEKLLLTLALNTTQDAIDDKLQELNENHLQSLQAYTNSIDEKVSEKIKLSLPTWKEQIFSNLLGSFAWSLLMAVIVIIGMVIYNNYFNTIVDTIQQLLN